MGTTFKMSWRNIWRNPRRTVLTMLAIGFGAALLVFSIGIQLGQYDMMISNSTRVFHGLLQVQKKGYLDEPKMRTSIADISVLTEKLKKETGMDAIAPRASGFALVSSEERTYGTMIVGVEPADEKQVSTIPGLIKEGRFLSASDADEAVIGRSLAQNMKLTPGDEITLLGNGRDGSIAATVMTVVGIFESGSRDLDRNMLEIPLGSFQEAFSMDGHGHTIVVYDEDTDQVHLLQNSIQALLGPEEDLVTLRWDQLQPGLKEMIELDYASGWLMYIVLVAIITFSIMNTFLMSVLERTREFGIMLALGYRPFSIGTVVILEAFFLALIALVAGMFGGLAVNTYFYYHGLTFPGMEEFASYYNLPPTITPQMSFTSVTLGPAVLLFATMLAAFFPVMRIRRLRAADAIKRV